ncbi:MAG: transglycosylase SLT domain-containing protein [Rhodospirillales bacterium]|nr:transglycosylase SLT domain-containing protein [Rhodospirillales bacterium]
MTGIAPIALLVALVVGGAQARATQTLAFKSDVCGPQIAVHERRLGIPRHLLKAIAHAESGRWDDSRGATIAWPWTVTSGGPGKYFPTKAAAIAEVRRLQAEGVTNIDVGCMQINLRYHPEAFRNLEDAFNPDRNVAYAGDFLRRLFNSTGSWGEAAQRYHSSDPDRGALYRAKVLAGWRLARGEPGETEMTPDTALNTARDTTRDTAIQTVANTVKPAVERNLGAEPVWTMERIGALNDRFRSRLSKNSDPTHPSTTAKPRSKEAISGKKFTGRSSMESKDFAARRQAQMMKWRESRGRF